jgi:hypothetical protein
MAFPWKHYFQVMLLTFKLAAWSARAWVLLFDDTLTCLSRLLSKAAFPRRKNPARRFPFLNVVCRLTARLD